MAGENAGRPAKSAEKALKQASKLAKDPAKTDEARKLIGEALKDSVLMTEARTYYIAGKIEDTKYGDMTRLLSINPADPKVDKGKMADALMAAHRNYVRAIELDTVQDKKGRIRTRYSNELAEWLLSHIPQFYNAGIQYISRKEFFPKGCEAFEVYALYPEQSYAGKHPEQNDSTLANAFFYAGICAYNGRQYERAAQDFRQAMIHNYPRQEALINQMVCFRRIAETDTTLRRSCLEKITALSAEGLRRYGYSDKVYIQKFVAGTLELGRPQEALDSIDSLLARNPDDTPLLSMKAETLAFVGRNAEALPIYRRLAEADDATFHILLSASKILTHECLTELNTVQDTGRASRKKRREISEKWLVPALKYSERAREIAGETPASRAEKGIEESEYHDLENTIATIHYYLVK